MLMPEARALRGKSGIGRTPILQTGRRGIPSRKEGRNVGPHDNPGNPHREKPIYEKRKGEERLLYVSTSDRILKMQATWMGFNGK